MGSYLPAPASPRRGMGIADLIMRRGDIAARRAAASGQIWGNALGNLGNIAAGAVQQHQAGKQEEERQQQFQNVLNDPNVWKDEKTAMQALFPVLGEKTPQFVAQAYELMAENELPDPERVAKARENLGARLRFFQEMDEDLKPGAWPGLLQAGKNADFGLTDEQIQAEMEYNPERHGPMVGTMLQSLEGPQKPVRGTEFQGDLVNPVTGETIREGGEEAQIEIRDLGDRVTGLDKKTGEELWTKEKGVTPRAQAPRAVRYLSRQISVDGKDMMANFDPTSGKYFNPDTGKVIESPQPPGGATIRNRKHAAGNSRKAGENLLKHLEDPEFMAEIGPVMGRGNSLLAQAGFGDERAQWLVGEIRGFAALQPQIHGFKAYRMAEEIENLLSTAQTPQALSAALRGVMAVSYIVSDEEPPTFEETRSTEQRLEDMDLEDLMRLQALLAGGE